MERVMITGQSGNVYFDQRGRPLRTMGDINVSVGQWVWTNGTTIYGHQAAGYNPPVIGGGLNGVPIWEYHKMCYIDTSQNIKDLVNRVYYDWKFFVNNKTHFYGIDNSGEIYNLKTAEIINGADGSSAILDAEISVDGDLYQLMSGNYSEANDPKQTLAKYYVDYESNGKNSGYYDWKLKYTDYEIGSGTVSTTSSPIKIYKGKNIVDQIDLKSVFNQSILTEIEDYTNQYSNAGTNGELIDGDRVPPDAYNKKMEINIIRGKISPDGQYDILATAYAQRVFFPWISYQFDKFQYNSDPPDFSQDDPIAPDTIDSQTIKGYYIAVASITNSIKITGVAGKNPSISIIKTEKNISSYYVRFPSRYVKFVYTSGSVPPASTSIAGTGDSKLLEIAGITNSTSDGDHGWYQYDVVPSLSCYMGESLRSYYVFYSYYTRLLTQWSAMGCTGVINNNVSGDNDITMPIQDNAYVVYHPDTERSDIYNRDGTEILSGFDKITPASKISLYDNGELCFLGIIGTGLYKITNGQYTDMKIYQYNTRLRKGNLSLLKRGIKKLS